MFRSLSAADDDDDVDDDTDRLFAAMILILIFTVSQKHARFNVLCCLAKS